MSVKHLLTRIEALPERAVDRLLLRMVASKRTYLCVPVLIFAFCAGASVWRAWGC